MVDKRTRSGVWRTVGTRAVQILMCPSFSLSEPTGIDGSAAVFEILQVAPLCKIFSSSCVKCATSVERVVCSATCWFPVQLSAVSFVAHLQLIDVNCV